MGVSSQQVFSSRCVFNHFGEEFFVGFQVVGFDFFLSFFLRSIFPKVFFKACYPKGCFSKCFAHAFWQRSFSEVFFQEWLFKECFFVKGGFFLKACFCEGGHFFGWASQG